MSGQIYAEKNKQRWKKCSFLFPGMGDVFWGTFQYEIDGNISPMSAFEIKVPHKNEHKFGQINKCDPSLNHNGEPAFEELDEIFYIVKPNNIF